MSHAEEQANEVEALQAIFQDDFLPTDGGGPAPVTAYRVRLAPEIGGDAKANHVVALLGVRYPPTYPEAPPGLEVTAERGLSPPQVDELRALVAECAGDNAGAPLVYVVAERVREWLQEHNEPAGEGSAYEEMQKRQRAKEREATGVPKGRATAAFSREADPSIKNKVPVAESRAEEEARRRAEGTPVTVERFLAWRARFEAEMEEKRRAEEASGIVSAFHGPRPVAGRLTGRAMFEQGVPDVALEPEDEGGDASAGAGGVGAADATGDGGFAIDAALFAGEDDVDLDDEDDEDDEDFVPDAADDVDDDDDDDDDAGAERSGPVAGAGKSR